VHIRADGRQISQRALRAQVASELHEVYSTRLKCSAQPSLRLITIVISLTRDLAVKVHSHQRSHVLHNKDHVLHTLLPVLPKTTLGIDAAILF